MDATNPKIFIIIVTWNGMKWMKECLECIRQSTVPVSTIVIDNGSTDDTCAFIRNNYPEIIVRETGKNLGFGQANNEGIRYALDNGADYVYLLNQDAYIYPDMFERLLAVAGKPESREIGIFSPLHIHGSRSRLDPHFKDYVKEFGEEFIEDYTVGKFKDVYFTECVPAAGWLLPKSTIETVGGFNPMFFHYGEDINYAQRVIYHKLKVGVVPLARMIHDREGFGNEKMAKKDSIIRGLESYILLNLNYPLRKCIYQFSKVYIAFFFSILPNIRNGNRKIVGEQFTAFFKVISRLNKYRKNRKLCKIHGAHWIEIHD